MYLPNTILQLFLALTGKPKKLKIDIHFCNATNKHFSNMQPQGIKINFQAKSRPGEQLINRYIHSIRKRIIA